MRSLLARSNGICAAASVAALGALAALTPLVGCSSFGEATAPPPGLDGSPPDDSMSSDGATSDADGGASTRDAAEGEDYCATVGANVLCDDFERNVVAKAGWVDDNTNGAARLTIAPNIAASGTRSLLVTIGLSGNDSRAALVHLFPSTKHTIEASFRVRVDAPPQVPVEIAGFDLVDDRYVFLLLGPEGLGLWEQRLDPPADHFVEVASLPPGVFVRYTLALDLDAMKVSVLPEGAAKPTELPLEYSPLPAARFVLGNVYSPPQPSEARVWYDNVVLR